MAVLSGELFRARGRCILSRMDRRACVKLVRCLEDDASRVPAPCVQLEVAILWLMDTTFTRTDPNEKTRLALTELRARKVLERFRKMNKN